jgi:uncharacterized pyridoxamine 5'-phosphate oxidase family protein
MADVERKQCFRQLYNYNDCIFLCCGKSIVFILQGSMRAAVTYFNRKNTWCIAQYDCNWAYKNLLCQGSQTAVCCIHLHNRHICNIKTCTCVQIHTRVV